MDDSSRGDLHRIEGGGLSAAISAEGAELQSLCDRHGREFLWQAGPVWPRHAPVLFPIVGRLAGDTLRHDGQDYRLGQHGFARDRRFEWAERKPTSCRLTLRDDAATRAMYPFAFLFEVSYVLTANSLLTTFAITNTGEVTLPASVGAHPAFIWPLRDGVAKSAHTLTFEKPEPAPICRVKGGLLQADPVPSPVVDRTLTLDEALFAADALIFDQLASHHATYATPGGPSIEMHWDHASQLGVWSKPPGDFLCIEPWHGFASPEGFDGEFADKPGLMLIAPGARRVVSLSIEIGGDTLK